MRPRLLVGIAGTATEIGKTWAAAALAGALRDAGWSVAARKPAQSFDPHDGSPTDAEVLARATGEHAADVCRPDRSYPVPMAPPMAADVLGLEPATLPGLVDELRWPDGSEVGLLETVGGVCSPVAPDGHSADLLRAVSVDEVVLVADAGLGTIDAVRSACLALHRRPIVFLNHFTAADDLHRRNAEWLRSVDGHTLETDVSSLAGRLATVLGGTARPPGGRT